MQHPDLKSYDRFVVFFSGGKDSVACVLHLLDQGVPREKIELWHHDVDGREGSRLMDWPVTPAYCRTFAEAFGLALYFSWKEGGFEGEMLRDDEPTRQTHFETPDGLRSAGGTGKAGTRRRFPQVSADLSVRWCSAYLKIDVATIALRNDPRFIGSRTLCVSGERGEESAARANYAIFEPHKADLRDGVRYQRHVDHWRPLRDWPEEDVWEIHERYRVNPHPAYRLGFGRVSCMTCIFGSRDQFASVQAIAPNRVDLIAEYESEFGCTMKRSEGIQKYAAAGEPYPMDQRDVDAAMQHSFDEPARVDNWKLPAGAFGESCGPI